MRVLLIALSLLLALETQSQCTAGFTFSVNGQTASFINQAATSQGSIVAWSWNFGDPASGANNISFLPNPLHGYTAAGTYMVSQTISTSTGCQDTYLMMIIIQPPFYEIALCPPAGSILLSSNTTGSTYQWQLSTDSIAYTNLVNGSNYAGVQSSGLQVNNLPSSFSGHWFRCLTDGVPGVPFKILFRNNWTGAQSNVWSNPANWSCGTLPDSFTDVTISAGTVIVDVSTTVHSLLVRPPASVTLQPGITLTVLR